jgi:predicted acetyltransferase
MTNLMKGAFGLLEVVRASAQQQATVANLLELYAHDFSEFHELKLGPDGRFGYPNLDSYWSDANRQPFLVWLDGQLAGFVLVKKGSELSDRQDVWDMAEFFVVRGYRRLGIGTQIAQDVWRKLPGPWEIRVMEGNRSAHAFWRHAISAFDGDAVSSSRFEKNGGGWHLLSFESPLTEQAG